MLQKFPALSRIFSKLFYELVPAAIASAVGAVLFHNLAKPDAPAPAPKVAISEPAADIVIQMLRDERALFADYVKPRGESPAKTVAAAHPTAPRAPAARMASKPKQLAARQPVSPPLATEPPLSLAPPAMAAQEPAHQPAHDNIVVASLRDITGAVERAPGALADTVASWFESEVPPRPPADVPMRNFLKAEM